jgi:hypothetical protein
LFDEPSRKGVSTLRYVPPTRAGKPIACRGLFQSMVWRLENENDFWLPKLTPAAPNETN